jgi:two-component system sensor histidine kinase MtrB
MSPRRRHLGIRIRAALAWATGGLVLSVALSVAAYQLVRTQLVSDREERATEQAYVNARAVRNTLRGEAADLNAVLGSLSGNTDSRSLTRIDGRWFSGAVGPGPSALPSAIQEVVADGEAGTQVADVDGVPHVVVGVPLLEVDARYFELVSLQDVEEGLGRLANGLVTVGVISTLAAALAGWYVSRQVLRPVRTMADAAEKIADGDLAARLDVFGDPDLEPLQRSFNEMADRVQERIDRERRFTSDVSHELRTPLTALLASVQIARRRVADPAAVDQALADLEERGEKFRVLVGDLLEISRIDAGVADVVPEAIDAEELVRAVLSATGHEGVEVRCRSTRSLHFVGDKRRVGQAVQNLLENADRYAGGAVAVELERVDGSVVINVDDQGPGVDHHERTHVFNRFARGRTSASTTDGSGLGLALALEHAQLHGGTVLISDSPHGGARFSIILPAGESAEARP